MWKQLEAVRGSRPEPGLAPGLGIPALPPVLSVPRPPSSSSGRGAGTVLAGSPASLPLDLRTG